MAISKPRSGFDMAWPFQNHFTGFIQEVVCLSLCRINCNKHAYIKLFIHMSHKQTWDQILLKVFKCICKYFSIFQMQMLLFSSKRKSKYFSKLFQILLQILKI